MDLWRELNRRNVFRVGVAYLLASWVIAQVADLVLENFGAPPWVMQSLLLFMAIGFVVAVIVSWVYEMTPEGIKRESEVARDDSITRQTGKRLNLLTIALVAVVAVLLLADISLDGTSRAVDQAASEASPSTGKTGAAPMVSSESTLPVVAVLPFTTLGAEEGGFLAGGLHDDLLTRLAKLDAFKVISRTSMMEYAGTTKNMRQISDELGARYILEGGIQAIGGRVRVNAQLIDAPVDEHIWAETYDRKMNAESLFDIQSELAYAIAAQLQTALSAGDKALIDHVPTQNLEAYSAYLRGLELRDSGGHNVDVVADAIAAFEEATLLDPEFAMAWAQLSISYSRLAQSSKEEDVVEAARAALERAVALEPELHEAEIARIVYLYRVEFEYAQALEALDALGSRQRLDASAIMLKAFLLRRLGSFAEAYQVALEARALDPRSQQILVSLIGMAWENDDCESADHFSRSAEALAPDSRQVKSAVALAALSCHGDAETANRLMKGMAFDGFYQRLIAITAADAARDWPTLMAASSYSLPREGPLYSVMGRINSVEALRQMGREAEAEQVLAETESMLEDLAHDEAQAGTRMYASAMSYVAALRGDKPAVLRWSSEHRRRLEIEHKGDKAMEVAMYRYFAETYALAGLDDEAIREIELAVTSPGGDQFALLDLLPAFDGLRDHPEYVKLKQRYGITP